MQLLQSRNRLNAKIASITSLCRRAALKMMAAGGISPRHEREPIPIYGVIPKPSGITLPTSSVSHLLSLFQPSSHPSPNPISFSQSQNLLSKPPSPIQTSPQWPTRPSTPTPPRCLPTPAAPCHPSPTTSPKTGNPTSIHRRRK